MNKMITKKRILAVGCTAAAAVIALGAVMIFGGCKDEKKEESSVTDVLEPVTEPPTEPTEPEIGNISAGNGLTGKAKVLLRENEDVVAYIRISNTNVDYPVLQYDGENLDDNGNSYYLQKDLYGNYLEQGVIFMDYKDNFEADESKQSENIVLYGHNMLSGAMFADLHKYRNDSKFYDKNPIIEFSSNYRDYKYIIFAYFLTSGDRGDSYYGEDFPYWEMEDLSDKKEFDKYMKLIKERTGSDPEIDVKYGDKLLTLQTCHLDVDNSRMLVVARRLRDHETLNSIDKAQSTSKPESSADSESENSTTENN